MLFPELGEGRVDQRLQAHRLAFKITLIHNVSTLDLLSGKKKVKVQHNVADKCNFCNLDSVWELTSNF